MSESIALFSEVDQTSDPEFFIRFLNQANANPDIQKGKQIIIDGLRLQPNVTVLDVGCGTGADVMQIAPQLGPYGAMTGVDFSEAMIAEAQRQTASSGLPVGFEVANAMALRFPDRTFDRCRAERLLMHVPDPVRALSEMVRVTKSSGRVCVFDFDWDTFIIDSPQRELTRRVVLSFSDSIRNGWIGRQMRRMFLAEGLTDVDVVNQQIFVDLDLLGLLIGGHLTQAQQSGTVDPGELEQWWDGLRQADARGRFLACFTAFIVSGTKV